MTHDARLTGQPWRFLGPTPGNAWPVLPDAAASAVLALLLQLERSEWLAPAELEAEQSRQLDLVARHAWNTVPHYRAAWEGCYDPSQPMSRERLASLAQVQRAVGQLQSRGGRNGLETWLPQVQEELGALLRAASGQGEINDASVDFALQMADAAAAGRPMVGAGPYPVVGPPAGGPTPYPPGGAYPGGAPPAGAFGPGSVKYTPPARVTTRSFGRPNGLPSKLSTIDASLPFG